MKGKVIIDVGIAQPMPMTTPMYLWCDGEKRVLMQWSVGTEAELQSDDLSDIAQLKMSQLTSVRFSNMPERAIHVHCVRNLTTPEPEMLSVLRELPDGGKVFFLANSRKFDKAIFTILGISPTQASYDDRANLEREQIVVSPPFEVLNFN